MGARDSDAPQRSGTTGSRSAYLTPLADRAIWFKGLLLLYTIASVYTSQTTSFAPLILASLLYMSLNLALPVVPSVFVRMSLSALSALLVLVSVDMVDPRMLLLAPPSLFELAAAAFRHRAVTALVLLAPAAFAAADLTPLYVFAALVTFAYFTLLQTYTDASERYRDEIRRHQSDIDRLARSLEESREWADQLEYTQRLEERSRLSQEIHDKIGHAMTGALIQMEASKRLLTADPEQSARLLQNAIELSKDGIEQIRRVLKSAKPPSEQLGVHRLKLMLDDFAAKHPFRTVLTHKGNLDMITPVQWKVIQDNVKEALTNVLKYSGATAVSVDIRVLNALVRAEVADNGRGAGKIVKGLGIVGMEERTAAVNGTLIVDGSRGFSVTMLMPCAKQADPVATGDQERP
jgi:Signal transduction histidine kinase